jgi:hypothetical protein
MPTTCTPPAPGAQSQFKPHARPAPLPAKRANPNDLVERAFDSAHVELVRRLVLQSIASIESVVFQRAETAETLQLKRTAASADHTVLLSIFLCLLNVDPGLKEAVMLSAAASNKHKLVGMLQHLRHTLVVDFFTDEGVSTAAFNHASEDLYIVS